MYTSDDLQKLLASATEALVKDVSNTALCSIRIAGKDGLVSISHYSSDESPDQPEMEKMIPIGDGEFIRTVGGDAVLTKEIQEVPDLSCDPRFSNKKIIDAGYASMMAVPIIFNDQAIGVAQIYSKTAGYRFSKKEKRIAQILVNNLAHVLVIKEQAEEIMRLQQGALEAQEHELAAKHALIVQHHFRNKITTIGGFVRRVANVFLNKSELTPDDLDKIKKSLGIIIADVEILERVLYNILTYAKKNTAENE